MTFQWFANGCIAQRRGFVDLALTTAPRMCVLRDVTRSPNAILASGPSGQRMLNAPSMSAAQSLFVLEFLRGDSPLDRGQANKVLTAGILRNHRTFCMYPPYARLAMKLTLEVR